MRPPSRPTKRRKPPPPLRISKRTHIVHRISHRPPRPSRGPAIPRPVINQHTKPTPPHRLNQRGPLPPTTRRPVMPNHRLPTHRPIQAPRRSSRPATPRRRPSGGNPCVPRGRTAYRSLDGGRRKGSAHPLNSADFAPRTCAVHELSLATTEREITSSRVSLVLRMQGYKPVGDTGKVTFGDRLREYRQHRGWSLADLSKATHYHRSYLSILENGRKVPNEDLARVCDEVLRAKGELIAAARGDTVSRLDQTPWQTAELVQRMQASDTTAGTLESLHATVEELCCQYNHRDALELRQEAHSWLQHVAGLLRRPVGLGYPVLAERATEEPATRVGGSGRRGSDVGADVGARVGDTQ